MSFLKKIIGATLALGLASSPVAFANAGQAQGQGKIKQLKHKVLKVRVVKAKQAKQAKQKLFIKKIQKPVQQKQLKQMLKQKLSQKKD